jgi:UDP-N-acetylglucosamine acyltransferase
MHVGTDTSRGATEIGDNGNFLAYAHIAHDCVVGKNATFANGATLGGHCDIGDNVGIGGLTAVHQFVRVGDNAFLGGCSAVLGDVIPFGMASGNRAKLLGLNVVGLRRAGLTKSELHLLRRTYKTIFDRSHTLAEGIRMAREEFSASPTAMRIIDFVSNRGKRNYVLPPVNARGDDDDSDAEG